MTEQPQGGSASRSTDLNQRPLVGAPALNEGDVVLVNDLGYPIGAAQASECHRQDTPLHLGYACFVFDPEDKVLVVRRAPDVTWYPLTWTTSVVGHPNSAQPIKEAIAVRLSHEFGLELHALRLVIPSFRYKATHAGIAENELCPVFAARVSGTFHFNSPENDHYAWIPWRVFRDDVLRGRRHVSPWCTLQIAGVARMGDDPARWNACLPSELPPAMMYSGAWDSPDFGRERAIARGGVQHPPAGPDAPVERIALPAAQQADHPAKSQTPVTESTPNETPTARRVVALTGPNAVVPLVAAHAQQGESHDTRASRRRHRDETESASPDTAPDQVAQGIPDTERAARQEHSAPTDNAVQAQSPAQLPRQVESPVEAPLPVDAHPLASSASVPPGIALATARAVASYQPPVPRNHNAEAPRASAPSVPRTSPLGSDAPSGIAVADAFGRRSDAARWEEAPRQANTPRLPDAPPADERLRLPGVADLEASLRELNQHRDNAPGPEAVTRADLRRQRLSEEAETETPAAPDVVAPQSRRERREAHGVSEPVNDVAVSLQHEPPRAAPRTSSLPAGLTSTDSALAMTGGIPVIPEAHPEWQHSPATSQPTPPPVGGGTTQSTTWGATNGGVWQAPMRARVDSAHAEASSHDTTTAAAAQSATTQHEDSASAAPLTSRRSVKEARQRHDDAPSTPPVGSIWEQMVLEGTAPADVALPPASPAPAPAHPAHQGWPQTASAEHLSVGDGWGSSQPETSISRTGATAADVAWLEQWERDHLQGPGRSAAPTSRDPYSA